MISMNLSYESYLKTFIVVKIYLNFIAIEALLMNLKNQEEINLKLYFIFFFFLICLVHVYRSLWNAFDKR